ncbi:hypothetical protein ACRQ5D_21490 [Mucilaginibacter sp. P25]|uniref:hypothetical protein n=1 Tax=Mucilaginibacter sp. P25 TaxID=3423945 RepID=UPI003D7982C7
MKQAGIKSYGIFPVYYNKKNVGIMEVFSYKEIVFYEKLLSKLQATIPLIAQLLQNSIDQFEARISSVIKNKFTSLQPSVQWKFNEVAWNYLKEKERRKRAPKLKQYHSAMFTLCSGLSISAIPQLNATAPCRRI